MGIILKKILFILNAMHIGGTEKAFLNHIDTLSRKEDDITLALLERAGGFLSEIPTDVHIHIIGGYTQIKHEIVDPPLQIAKELIHERQLSRAFGVLFTHFVYKVSGDRTLYYRYVLKEKKMNDTFDAVHVFDGPFDLLTVFGLYCVKAKRKIQWIHFDVSKFNFNVKIGRKLYPKFDEIRVVSDAAREQLLNKIPEIKAKTITVPNVVSYEQCRKMADMGEGFTDQFNGIRIVTVGRLSEEKGQDMIPEVAAKLKETGVNFKWYLVGDGKLRPVIEQKCRECDVTENVVFLGIQANPYQYLKNADLYVQTSKHEGFCITLAEAKAFALPIVSTDCAGAHEQLDERSNCVVVERNVYDMTHAIMNLVEAFGNE